MGGAANAGAECVGFRRIDAERGSCVARMRAKDGGQVYRALGAATAAFGYNEATASAAEWFRNQGRGVAADAATACSLVC